MKLAILTLGLTTLILGACAITPPKPNAIVREFVAHKISRVILRASSAKTAIVTRVIMDTPTILISGVPARVTRVQLPGPPTPASRWGLEFMARRYGSTLVISTKHEIDYIPGCYTLEDIRIQLPDSVSIVRETRELFNEGPEDLSPP